MASAACCKLSPVTHDYDPKGKDEVIADLNTYVVGPQDATKVIIFVYDIFGRWPQTIQGADRLSAHTGALVLVPDFFKGKGMPPGTLPMNTPEKKKIGTDFFSNEANLEMNVAKLLEIRKYVGEKYLQADSHCGVFGLCWGGKLAVLACGEGNEGAGRRFQVSGTAHPGLMDAKDADVQTAPHIMLASKDEPTDIVAAYKTAMGDQAEVTTYDTMHHGWMGARAKLEDAANVQEYERGYEQVGVFFSKHL